MTLVAKTAIFDSPKQAYQESKDLEENAPQPNRVLLYVYNAVSFRSLQWLSRGASFIMHILIKLYSTF